MHAWLVAVWKVAFRVPAWYAAWPPGLNRKPSNDDVRGGAMTLEDEAEHIGGADERLAALLQLILRSAVEVLGFDAATVTARQDGGEPATVAVTDQRMVALDDSQYVSGQGPCLDVMESESQVFVPDAGSCDRWPEFQQTAAHMGIQTVLSTGLDIEPSGLAASLNLYARRRMEQSEAQMQLARGFAAQLAAAMDSIDAYRTAARLAQDMAVAMRSRAVIEQAKGMLMAERQIDADEAFGMLRQLSQNSNVKLAEVAARLVADRAGNGA
jgi:GAF domain-containing protein